MIISIANGEVILDGEGKTVYQFGKNPIFTVLQGVVTLKNWKLKEWQDASKWLLRLLVVNRGIMKG